MDITLKRIFLLMEHKENGKIARGGKARFARSIGYDSGDIVSMWENGSSKSYLKKLHEIAAKYDVSVEWLKGETDDMGGTGQYQEKSPAFLAGAAAGVAGAVLFPGAAAIAAIDTAGAALLASKKKKPDSQKATEREKEFVQLFDKLTPEQQDFFLAQLRGVVDSQDK